MSSLNTKTLVSKYHSPIEGTKAPWKNGWFQRWGRKKYKISLKHLVVSENKEAFDKGWGIWQKDKEDNPKELPVETEQLEQ